MKKKLLFLASFLLLCACSGDDNSVVQTESQLEVNTGNLEGEWKLKIHYYDGVMQDANACYSQESLLFEGENITRLWVGSVQECSLRSITAPYTIYQDKVAYISGSASYVQFYISYLSNSKMVIGNPPYASEYEKIN